MKVLFVTYPMAFHTPGGGEIQLLAYKKYLEAKGVQVDLFDPWNPNFLDYDLVHFFSCVGGSIHFCNFIKTLGLPLAITSSLWITEETKSLYPIDEIRAQLSLADVIVTNSDLESETLSTVLGLAREKFSTVYNGVDDMFYQRVDSNLFREQFGVKGDFILNVGNIEPRKNQLTLVKAMNRFPNKKLILIGHVRDKSYFNEIMYNANDGQVVYLGPLDHDSVLLKSAYQACQVFCLPSTLETPGLAALEAKTQGAACVITSEGSTKEYFKDTVVYCDHRSVSNIVEAISHALKDSAFKNNIVNNVMSWNEAVVSLIDVYDKLAGNSNVRVS